MKNLKKAQLALAVAVTLSAGFGATGIASADTASDVETLKTEVSTLKSELQTLRSKVGSTSKGSGTATENTETYNKVQIGSFLQGYDAESNNFGHAVAASRSVAIGGNAEASGQYAVAIGNGIKNSERPIAAGEASIAIGNGTSTLNNTNGARAYGSTSIAMGTASVANGNKNIAIGNTARTGTQWVTGVQSNQAHYDYDLKVDGHYLTEISTKDKDTSAWKKGVDYDYSETTDDGTKYYNYVAAGTAEAADALDNTSTLKDGYFARTTTKDGVTTTTYYTYATDYSNSSTTISVPQTTNAIAIGNSVYSNNDYSVALGNDVTVNSSGSIAIGAHQDTNTTIVNSRDSVAIGNGVIVGEENTLDDGSGKTPGDNVAIATRAAAKSGSASAYGAYSHAYGAYSTAIGSYSHALAANSTAIGNNSEVTETAERALAAGYATQADGEDSIALGDRTTTSAAHTIAIGSTLENVRTTSATAENATAIGRGVQATAEQALALGYSTIASGTSSIAQGHGAQALAENSIALGKSASVAATETSAVALGTNSVVAQGDGNVISVGSSKLNRKIIHVSAGTTNTDAANYGQLLKADTYTLNKAGNYSVTLKTNDGTNGPTITLDTSNLGGNGSVSVTGEVKSGDTNAVSGNTVYNEVRPTTDGSYVKTTNTTAANLSALDSAIGDTSALATTVKDKDGNALAADKQNVAGYLEAINGKADQNATNIGNMNQLKVTDANGNKATSLVDAVNAVNDKVASTIGSSPATDGNYITAKESDGTTATTVNQNLKKLDDAIGAKITENGNAIKANTSVNDNLKNLDAAIGSDDDYGTAFNNISKVTVDKDTKESHATTVKENIGALDAAIGKAKDLGTILDKDGKALNAYKDEDGEAKNTSVVDAVKAVNEKVGDLDQAKTYNVLEAGESLADNLEAVDTALGDLDSFDSIKDVTGKALKKEAAEGEETGVSVAEAVNAINGKVGDLASDGNYITAGKSVNDNLSALDDQVFTNTNDIARLGDRLNKVGAGAAALAALHVEDFDADNKLSFAAGFGHYKNANAGAIGAFYKPNHDTTFSVASTVGNGDTMVNAGVSFKLGKSAHVEKTMVAKADYEALQNKVAAQDERLASQDAQIEELKAQVAALVAKG